MNTEVKLTPKQEPLSELPKGKGPQKRWKLTRSDNQDPARITRNLVIDQAYMFLLSKIKELYKGSNTEAFELDIRHDRSFSSSGMHTFCTPDLSLELECGFDLICCVTYDFEDCQYQEQVLAWLQGSFSLRDAAVHTPVKGGIKACFARLKQLHSASCFTVL